MAGIIILVISTLFVVFLVVFLKGVRNKAIVHFDSIGITTQSGKNFPWSSLISIEYYRTLNRVSKEKKIHSLHFQFKEGKASVGYLMKNILPLIKKADELLVPKTEKIVGYHIK